MIINDKKYRIVFLTVLLFAMVVLFIFRLAQLQIVKGDYYKQLADNKMVQKINESAPRGSIITSDGYVVAKNRIGYAVNLTYANMDEGKRNQIFLYLYNILERNKETFKDEFPIAIVDNTLVFTFQTNEEKWKKDNQIPTDADAGETLEILRNRYNVKEEVNNEVAIDAIEKVHLGKSLPLMMKDGELIFKYAYQEEDWKKSYGFEEEEYNLTAEESFEKLKKSFEIDDSYSSQDARKVMVFRQILKNQGFRSWEPVEIAKDVSLKTVMDLDIQIHQLTGVSVVANPIREYPFKNLASHVIGYIGKVNEADVEDNGYKMSDMKGISGIESAFEDYLKGEDGEKLTITDYKGRPQDGIAEETKDPVPGSDVFLTIDYDLQQTAEKALADQINQIRSNGRAPNASSGAVVAMNAKTGAILAMASYPDYDPNLFATGISTNDWKNLNVTVKDPLYPKPLYNNAALTALQPGSTFKPMMAISGLEEGTLTASTAIYCRGVHPVFTQFTCLGRHGAETVTLAIRDSCNVFFYETGYRLGIDNIEKYASAFGLGEKTGIEIAESSGYLATKEDKKKNWTYSTSDYLRSTVGIEGTAMITNDEGDQQEVYKSYAIAKELFAEVDQENYKSYGDVYRKATELLSKYNIKETRYLHKITQYILAGRWVASDTINASIGQGGNSFTPIQLANYISTLVNGGVHRETYLVDKVVSYDNKIVYQHKEKILNMVAMNQNNVDLVKQGMKMVAMYSTGRAAFTGFDHNGIGVGGKTGTAQYGKVGVDNTAWFVSFAPYNDPEIVVVSMIVQGYASSNAVPIARKVIDTYFYNNSTFEQVEANAAAAAAAAQAPVGN
ncbi:MAG: hypothetical protein HGA49_06565 [Eubacteriaceae bacterium]|nr:hypothetical protein [Eubacteriaceae bacterium]